MIDVFTIVWLTLAIISMAGVMIEWTGWREEMSYKYIGSASKRSAKRRLNVSVAIMYIVLFSWLLK